MGRPDDVFARIVKLQEEGKPFVLATVVARRPPVSAHLGDRAIVFADGRMEGFVGGACAREIVRQQALDALSRREGRLVSIRPDVADITPSSAEHVVVPMTCASEGAVDVYIEPFVQAPALFVVGNTPVAEALARLARAADNTVTRVVDAREREDVTASSLSAGTTVIALDELEGALDACASAPAVVVASQGHYDEEALEVVLRSGTTYVGLVASRQRAATVRGFLQDRHVPGVERLRSPVGLDLGARTPQEVALSILADIVRDRALRSPLPEMAGLDAAGPSPSEPVASATFGIDPVCGMRVEMAAARHTAEVAGVTYYFCCPHCRAHFVKQTQD